MATFETLSAGEFSGRLGLISVAMSDMHRSVIEAGDVPYEIVTDPDVFLNIENAQRSVQEALGRLGNKFSRIVRGDSPKSANDRHAADNDQLYDPIWIQVGLNQLMGATAAGIFTDERQDFYPVIKTVAVASGEGGMFANNGQEILVEHGSGDTYTPTENYPVSSERVNVSATSEVSYDEDKKQFTQQVKAKQRFITGGLDDFDIWTDDNDYEVVLSNDSDLPQRLLEAIEAAVKALQTETPRELRYLVAESLAS